MALTRSQWQSIVLDARTDAEAKAATLATQQTNLDAARAAFDVAKVNLDAARVALDALRTARRLMFGDTDV